MKINAVYFLESHGLSSYPVFIASLNHRDELVWTTNVAPSVLENGMQLDTSDNSLVIPSSGLYFVYSQVVFHKDPPFPYKGKVTETSTTIDKRCSS